MSQLHDELLIGCILPWLVEDVSDAVWLSSVCQSWRRSVLNHLHFRCRDGYGVLKLTVCRSTGKLPVALLETFGGFIGEAAVLWGGCEAELEEAVGSGYYPNLKSITSPYMRPSERLLDNIVKLVRLNFSFCEEIDDDGVSLCCSKLPNLVELLLSWTCISIEGHGWLDDETQLRPWRVLRLDLTKVPIPLVAAVCCSPITRHSLQDLGFTITYEQDSLHGLRLFQQSVQECRSLRSMHAITVNAPSGIPPLDVALSATLTSLSLENYSMSDHFVQCSLKPCSNLVKLEIRGVHLAMSDEEMLHTFQWLGSNPRLQWLDLSDITDISDSCFLEAYFAALQTISPAPLRVLKIAGWMVMEGMLLDLLESSPNITFLDLMRTGVTTSMSVLLHGLWSKRVTLPDAPRGRTSYSYPGHGLHEIENEFNDFKRLTMAYQRICNMRREPTHGVEIIDSSANLISIMHRSAFVVRANAGGYLDSDVAPSLRQPLIRQLSTVAAVKQVEKAEEGVNAAKKKSTPRHKRRETRPDVLSFSIFDPFRVGGEPVKLHNFVDGQWLRAESHKSVVDPLNGEVMAEMPQTNETELEPFLESMKSVPKCGLHNPLRHLERYRLYGKVSCQLASALRIPEIRNHFAKCIQRVTPKSWTSCLNEVDTVRVFLDNFSGDQVRFLARGITTPGDLVGQETRGYRWPFGSTVLITPYVFPLAIPVLQLMGALYMGNHVTLKCSSIASVVMEEWIRLMLSVGAPKTDVDLLHSDRRVAEQLATNGRIKVSTSGLDWKILGPVKNLPAQLDHVARACDEDAFAYSGQSCSAQGVLFAHQDWVQAGLFQKMEKFAAERSLADLTIGPVLSHSTTWLLDHIKQILKLPGARLLFGGRALEDHSVARRYGLIEPTALYVPLEQLSGNPDALALCSKETLAPIQICTKYSDSQFPQLLDIIENLDSHLTAGLVTDDPQVRHAVLGATVNGTTYVGLRSALALGPSHHWLGPGGDPRAAGLGTADAIKSVWSYHREIVEDDTPIDEDWARPPPS
ncbi:Succinate-semialdehyde dehydrogenase, mitochondrial [Perkinsus chesapeaki]|uniref:Succinate-semialdehyde dehydrogenase, mitochondrial n=1 Tax=Perkinsus chesapeaki TaxID=330153 RepID=A0A7J6L9A9_PERCH|nr:Succinate-semialdehyde dehydrogenase, mitochondrial [Perkinsus chesapeaki]